jgi:hypothetical protein
MKKSRAFSACINRNQAEQTIKCSCLPKLPGTQTMKLIVIGATGFVGGQTLKAAIADERVDEVIAVTRCKLPSEVTQKAKVKVIIHDDFGSYPSTLLDHLKGSEACLW